MFKKTRKFLTIILALTLMSSMMIQPLHAAVINEETLFQPQWQNTTNMILTVNLNNPQISLAVTVTGYSGTTYKNGTAVLEKISGSNCGEVKTWTGLSSNSAILSFSDSSLTRTKGTYRLTFTVTSVRNGIEETVTAYKDATY